MTNLRSGGRRPQAKVDDLDRQLLAYLQKDARVPTAELARRLHLSGPGLQKRLRKLENQGVIRGYATVVNREAVGLDLFCFIHVTLAHHRPNSVKQFPEKIKNMPEVLECHFLTGEFDYLLKVVVANHDHLEKFLFGKLMKAGGVDRTRTSIVVKEVKTSTYPAPVTVLASTRALLENTVDYAGTFPPATLRCRKRSPNYAAARTSPGAGCWGAWSCHAEHPRRIGRRHCPCTRSSMGTSNSASSSERGRRSSHPGHTRRSLSQLARVDTFNQRWGGRARLCRSSSLQPQQKIFSVSQGRWTRARDLLRSATGCRLEGRLDAIATAGGAAKVRTGGIMPAAIPRPSSLAQFLHGAPSAVLRSRRRRACIMRLRSCYSLTYERDSATAVMHGFLNVSVAAALAAAGASVDDIVEALHGNVCRRRFASASDSVVCRDSTTALAGSRHATPFFSFVRLVQLSRACGRARHVLRPGVDVDAPQRARTTFGCAAGSSPRMRREQTSPFRICRSACFGCAAAPARPPSAWRSATRFSIFARRANAAFSTDCRLPCARQPRRRR